MPCTCPRDAYPPSPDSVNRRFVFSPQASYAGARPIKLPCGQCIGCRLDRRAKWATRIVHESQLHRTSIFCTPTFDDEHLPADLSVSVRTHQLFIKRVRKCFGAGVRFYGAGEYGGKSNRPHYHTILFGAEVDDRKYWKRSEAGFPLWRSATLERIWPFGHILFSDVDVGSAEYAAGYCVKKINGAAAAEHYRRSAIDPATGEVRVWQVAPEFGVMSRRPGLGSGWLDKFQGDVFPSDFCVINGRKRSVPGYYTNKLGARAKLEVVSKRKRKARRAQVVANNTERRLLTRTEFNRLEVARECRSLDGEM